MLTAMIPIIIVFCLWQLLSWLERDLNSKNLKLMVKLGVNDKETKNK